MCGLGMFKHTIYVRSYYVHVHVTYVCALSLRAVHAVCTYVRMLGIVLLFNNVCMYMHNIY